MYNAYMFCMIKPSGKCVVKRRDTKRVRNPCLGTLRKRRFQPSFSYSIRSLSSKRIRLLAELIPGELVVVPQIRVVPQINSLVVVPQAGADLLFRIGEEGKLVASSVLIMNARSQQMAAVIGSPGPPRLRGEGSAIIQFFA